MHLSSRLLAAAFVATTAASLIATPLPAHAEKIPHRCMYTDTERTLRYGSSGTVVRQAQCEYNMATRGTDLVVDGSYGPRTASAIRRFQDCVGITVDGIVGPITWNRLNDWARSNGYPANC